MTRLSDNVQCHKSYINQTFDGYDFSFACLDFCDFSNAVFRNCSFRGAKARKSIFTDAVFQNVDFVFSDFSCADLRRSIFTNADFFYANLTGADLSDASFKIEALDGAILHNTLGLPTLDSCCPAEGEFTGYKAVGNYLVKLLIPADAKRASYLVDKCRCNKAVVLEIQDIDTDAPSSTTVTYSNRDRTFEYKVGQTVCVSGYDDNPQNGSSPAIHFFRNRQDAVWYWHMYIKKI